VKSIHYVFLLSFLVCHDSFLSAIGEEVAKSTAIAKPVEDSDAMKARHAQELEELNKLRQDKIDEYNREVNAYKAKESTLIKNVIDARSKLNHGEDDSYDVTSNYDDSSAAKLKIAVDELKEHRKTHVDLNLKRIGLDNSYTDHLANIENLKARHASEIEAGSFLPEVKKDWKQSAVDWIKALFGHGDVADAKAAFTNSDGVKTLKNGGKSQNPSDREFDKRKLKKALEKLSADQIVDVVNDYLKNSLKGNNNTELAMKNTQALVETLNSMLPAREKVSVGSNKMSIMRRAS
jgi:hypothetical protein